MANLRDFLITRIAEDEVQLSVCRDLNWFPGKKYGLTAVSYEQLSTECQAKRRTIALYDELSHSGEPDASFAWTAMKAVLRYLAAPYSDHPDYQKEWNQ